MRTKSLLSIEPLAPVCSLAELYAIAFGQAETAARRYGQMAVARDESFELVRSVFEELEKRELHRARCIGVACFTALNKQPDAECVEGTPADIVPIEEIAELANSSLSTPYTAWALAVRHRARGFVFWTYVAAHASDEPIRLAAETMARDALHDANELRRARRLAWRSERKLRIAHRSDGDSSDIPVAALLESLLLKDIFAWSQGLPAIERRHLLSVIGNDQTGVPAPAPASGDIAEIKRRAIRHAEQLSSIYIDDADRAGDDAQLELAQKLAARAIARLAELRTIAWGTGK